MQLLIDGAISNQIPQDDDSVQRAWCQHLAIWTEDKTRYASCVASKRLAYRQAGCHVPQPECFVIAARCQYLAVWTKGKVLHGLCMSDECRSNRFLGGYIP